MDRQTRHRLDEFELQEGRSVDKERMRQQKVKLGEEGERDKRQIELGLAQMKARLEEVTRMNGSWQE